MKFLRIYLTGLLFCLMTIPVLSQTLSFGEYFDQNTTSLVGQNSSFTSKENTCSVCLYVQLPYEILCSEIFYDIYSFNESTQQDQIEFSATQEVEADWSYFYKTIDFNKSGKYKVKVIDCEEIELVSNVVIIKVND